VLIARPALDSIDRMARNDRLNTGAIVGIQQYVVDIRQQWGYARYTVEMRRNDMTKTSAGLLQGTLDLLLLKTLAPGPMHGWGISQRIRQISEEFLRVNQGSLYPALHRMELKGWIVSEEGLTETHRRVRFYRLTAAGRRRLGEEMRDWDQMVVAIGSVLKAT